MPDAHALVLARARDHGRAPRGVSHREHAPLVGLHLVQELPLAHEVAQPVDEHLARHLAALEVLAVDAAEPEEPLALQQNRHELAVVLLRAVQLIVDPVGFISRWRHDHDEGGTLRDLLLDRIVESTTGHQILVVPDLDSLAAEEVHELLDVLEVLAGVADEDIPGHALPSLDAGMTLTSAAGKGQW